MQLKFLKRIYKNILSFFGKYLPIQVKPNALYSKKDIVCPVIRASMENTTVESSCRRFNNISADSVFYHLNKLSFKQIKECFDKGIEDSLLKAKKKYRLTAATIAIDINDIPYYGEIEGIGFTTQKMERPLGK